MSGVAVLPTWGLSAKYRVLKKPRKSWGGNPEAWMRCSCLHCLAHAFHQITGINDRNCSFLQKQYQSICCRWDSESDLQLSQVVLHPNCIQSAVLQFEYDIPKFICCFCMSGLCSAETLWLELLSALCIRAMMSHTCCRWVKLRHWAMLPRIGWKNLFPLKDKNGKISCKDPSFFHWSLLDETCSPPLHGTAAQYGSKASFWRCCQAAPN